MNRTLRGGLLIGAASLIGVLVSAGAAQAHVTIDPKQASQGGYTRIAFRVPTESDTASTTKLDVNLPTDQPIASVSIEPVPGWTGTLIKKKLPKPITTDDGEVTEAVTEITWTATSADTAIKPGQFQEFPVSLGPLPKTGSIAFKVLQTYSDGNIVRWIEVPTPGQAEPENPAPVLTLTTASSDSAAGVTAQPPVTAQADPAGGTSSTAALVTGIIGAVFGLVGLILGGLAYVKTRRTA
ncbi:YcnI family copper-binding membrane protein [Rugosimonospora africana]|uniref:Membrane protein n=1 Tax=Rugosimonospora africana TaxID=556532 RepID=A0A8J3QR32_9ACTN|nr:YcnI family protein [Rugosimonospora africana]GIH14212.1 membrane protein [Rugosimonospora africana]